MGASDDYGNKLASHKVAPNRDEPRSTRARLLIDLTYAGLSALRCW